MEFKPISLIKLNKIRQSIENKYKLQVPTYEIKLPNGQVEIHKHDEKSIADKDTSQAEKEAWEKYQVTKKEMEAAISEKSTAYAFYHGIECEIPEEWLEEQKWLEIELPENKRDLKLMYVTEMLTTPYDIKNAYLEILKLSTKGVDKSTVNAVEDSFRSTLSD